MKTRIKVIINGKICTGRAGQTLLEIAQNNGIEIPNLCHNGELKHYGGCSLCVVEAEESPKLLRACSTVAQDGQVIYTESERVVRTRKTSIELLMSDHDGDCRGPCVLNCPASVNAQGYVQAIARGDDKEAVRIIKERLPMPACIGRVCPHPCEDGCRRQMVEESISIAYLKYFAADRVIQAGGYLPPKAAATGKRVGIIGGGPGGLTAAYYLSLKGHRVTVVDAMPQMGGMLRYGIPEYRLPKRVLDEEVAEIASLGVEMKNNFRIGRDVTFEEFKNSYDAVVLAIGAWESMPIGCPGEELDGVMGGIDFLRQVAMGEKPAIGDQVAVVGGGNTAMDAARAALRAGAKSSTLVYRRTKKYMPADAEELEMAIADGVEFLELVAPVEQKDGKLICEKMKLGDPDDKGRRQPVPTGEMVEIPCDTVVSAVGEKVESEVFTRNGITVDEKGIPAFKTNLEGVYAGGDAMRGPATVVEGIADAQYFANAVIGEAHKFAIPAKAVATREEAVAKKGVLCESAKCEGDRCLTCNVVCQVCADVCPNRANVVIELPDGRQQILHVDRMCNECGNCAVFCPYDSAPYREKFTLFLTREGFDESVNNQGFLPLGGKKVLVRLDSKVFEADLDAKNDLPADIEVFIWTVLTKYAYLMG